MGLDWGNGIGHLCATVRTIWKKGAQAQHIVQELLRTMGKPSCLPTSQITFSKCRGFTVSDKQPCGFDCAVMMLAHIQREPRRMETEARLLSRRSRNEHSHRQH